MGMMEMHMNDDKTSDSKTSDNKTGVLTDEQKDAIAALASENTYAKQSKWKTFNGLPQKDKWPYFVQHFLLGTVLTVAALAVAVSLICTMVFRAPDPQVSVAVFNMSGYSKQMDTLKRRFVDEYHIKDDRVVDIGDSYQLGEGSAIDDSAKVMAMVTAGTITMVVSDRKMFPELVERGYVTAIRDVEGGKALSALGQTGAMVDKNGEPTDKMAQAKGLDLGKSETWMDIGLPDDAIIGFSNVTKTADHACDFVDFLRFKQ
jgi:hypothetical protein